MFEKLLCQIGASLDRHSLPYITQNILKNPKIDIQYIRVWLKEFDASSDEKVFLKTFEDVFKELGS